MKSYGEWAYHYLLVHENGGALLDFIFRCVTCNVVALLLWSISILVRNGAYRTLIKDRTCTMYILYRLWECVREFWSHPPVIMKLMVDDDETKQ